MINHPDTKKVPPDVGPCIFAGEIEWILCVASDSLSSVTCQLELIDFLTFFVIPLPLLCRILHHYHKRRPTDA